MKPLLRQLENESLLLLYMAGELPDDDRRELELLLARDGGLRMQLQSLESAERWASAALEAMDRSASPPAMEPAVRSVVRSMNQWKIDRLARPAEPRAARSKMPIIGWSVGSAVAALLVFCIWWGFRSDVNPHLAAETQPSSGTGGGSQYVMQIPANSMSPSTPSTDGGDNSNPVQMVSVDSSNQRLGELESMVSEDFARE